MKTKTLVILLAGTSLLTGCVAPTPNAGYFSMSPEQAEANRRNTHRVELEGYAVDNVDRMNKARAIETATRNNPSYVAPTTTIIVP